MSDHEESLSDTVRLNGTVEREESVEREQIEDFQPSERPQVKVDSVVRLSER